MVTLVSIGRDARWKLVPYEHREIRRLSRLGVPDKELVKTYKVSHQQISKIIDRNKTRSYWSKLTAKRNKKRYQTDPEYRKKVSEIKKKVWYKRKKLKI